MENILHFWRLAVGLLCVCGVRFASIGICFYFFPLFISPHGLSFTHLLLPRFVEQSPMFDGIVGCFVACARHLSLPIATDTAWNATRIHNNNAHDVYGFDSYELCRYVCQPSGTDCERVGSTCVILLLTRLAHCRWTEVEDITMKKMVKCNNKMKCRRMGTMPSQCFDGAIYSKIIVIIIACASYTHFLELKTAARWMEHIIWVVWTEWEWDMMITFDGRNSHEYTIQQSSAIRHRDWCDDNVVQYIRSQRGFTRSFMCRYAGKLCSFFYFFVYSLWLLLLLPGAEPAVHYTDSTYTFHSRSFRIFYLVCCCCKYHFICWRYACTRRERDR